MCAMNSGDDDSRNDGSLTSDRVAMTVVPVHGVAVTSACLNVPVRGGYSVKPPAGETLTGRLVDITAPPVSHEKQACFVPPLVATGEGEIAAETPPPSCSSWRTRGGRGVAGAVVAVASSSGHRRGGRRPNNVEQLSPEEERRRHLRRERNKQAAARCRMRRLELTMSLQHETESLEAQRAALQREVHKLRAQKEQLQFILDSHFAHCKITGGDTGATSWIGSRGASLPVAPAPPLPTAPTLTSEAVMVRHDSPADISVVNIKMEMPEDLDRHQQVSLSSAEDQIQLPLTIRRPSSLVLRASGACSSTPSTCPAATAAVSVSTPSVGLALGFDSLMDGSSALTPVGGALAPLLPVAAASSSCPSSLLTPIRSDMTFDMIASPDTSKHLVSL